MEPRIETISEIKLIGKSLPMSFANDRTGELWGSFMPKKSQIENQVDSNLYSVQLYPDTDFFHDFNPVREFEKWAAINVSDHEVVPPEMAALAIPSGLYAVFHYKGRPSQAQATFQYIFTQWLPKSKYTLDHRPHFALMGENYKGEDPDSEEEFWIPIRE